MTKEKLFLSGACVFGLSAIALCTVASIGQNTKLVEATESGAKYSLTVNASTIKDGSITYYDEANGYIASFKVTTTSGTDINFKVNESPNTVWIIRDGNLVCKRISDPVYSFTQAGYLYNDYTAYEEGGSPLKLTKAVTFERSTQDVRFRGLNDSGSISIDPFLNTTGKDPYKSTYQPTSNRKENSFAICMGFDSYDDNEMILYNIVFEYDCN